MESTQHPRMVLIADDSESSRDLMRFILVRFGCHVVEARDGLEALTQAATTRPDLFILDLNMPRLDGYRVASELRRQPPFASTPILALSAAETDADPVRLHQAGFSMSLGKPIAPARLRECLALLLELPGS